MITVMCIYSLKEPEQLLEQELMQQQDKQMRNKGIILKHCAPFTNCISEINDTLPDNANDLDAVMLMYNLKGYSNN